MRLSHAVRATGVACVCGLLLGCGGGSRAPVRRAQATVRDGPAAGVSATATAPPGAATQIAMARGSATAAPTPAVTTSAPSTAPAPATTAPSAAPAPRRRRDSPGSLPQTMARPSAATRGFHAEMRHLWRGITSDSVQAALPAFFPETAYAQLKAIYDPEGDWQARLVGYYRLDIGAAHSLLGANPGSAELLRVQVPSGYAHWVAPNLCENRVGYYEVPNSRVVYSEQGEVRSFGIASMISWRGVWYVVHLGAVDRQVAAGEVDDPATGSGVSADSGTC